MNRRDQDTDQMLDQVLAEVRGQALDARSASAATDRAWDRIAKEIEARTTESTAGAQPIRGCVGFQNLIADHLAGRLTGGTRLLFLDHVGECIPCRRALKGAQSKSGTAAQIHSRAPRSASWMTRTAWRLAAAAVIVLALVGVSFKSKALSFKSGGLIHIEAAEGEVLRIGRAGSVPLTPGDTFTLGDGEFVRTGHDSTAVLTLADLSRVEMRQRSQLAVQEQRYLLPGQGSDGVLGLERGGIIVEASKQGSGHLYVDTDDCRVAVTGTVFSVSHGTKGSRVSVVEGEVHVDQAGTESILHPGDQASTNTAIVRVPVEQDIAWSRNSRQYVELLREVRALSREIDAVMRPGLRYETDLLDLAPANTVVWVGVPNMSGQLSDAFQILQERVASNELLRDWWAHMSASGELERVLDKIRTYGQYLGPELVVSLSHDANGKLTVPLVFARLSNPAAFRDALKGEIASIAGAHPEVHLQLLEGTLPATAPAANGDSMLFWIEGGLVAASPSLDRLRELQASVQDGTPAGGAFHTRLAEVYHDGVEWVVGVDLEHILPHDQTAGPLEQLGLLDVQHLIAEREQLEDQTTQNRVVLTFSQPRRHLAAWLADPAPMGALDYVSPDANFAAAMVIKEPNEMVAELFEFLCRTDSGFGDEIAHFETENGIDVRRDFAAPLGGEIAVALDGPMLPSPAWKLVLEVYDPARLEQTIEWIVGKLQEQAVEHGRAGFRLDRETADDHEFFRLVSLDTGLELSYVFDHGYLVAAPSRGLIERALQTRRSGVSLPGSPAFKHLLPADGHDDFSGVLYHNLAPVLGTFSRVMHGATTTSASPEQVQFLEGLGDESRPGVVLLYGEERRITLTGVNEGGLFGSGLGSLSSFGGLLGVQQSLAQTLAHGAEASR